MSKKDDDIIPADYQYEWSPKSDGTLKDFLGKVRDPTHHASCHGRDPDAQSYVSVQTIHGAERWHKTGVSSFSKARHDLAVLTWHPCAQWLWVAKSDHPSEGEGAEAAVKEATEYRTLAVTIRL